MQCTKLQLWPAASYSGGFRFEGGKKVEAYYYDNSSVITSSERWQKNQVFFLNGATTIATVAASLAVLGLTAM